MNNNEIEVSFEINPPQLEAEFIVNTYDVYTFRDGLKKEDFVVDVIPATPTNIGGVIVGGNIIVNKSGVISVPYSTNESNGVIRIATNGEVEEGTLENVAVTPKQLIDIKIHVKEYVDQKIAEEKARAKAAEEEIQTNLDLEVTRAENVESLLDNKISDEKARALISEQGLGNRITNETTRATNVESTLQIGITAEEARAKGVEATLAEVIRNEITRATNAESIIRTDLTTEINRAKTREEELQVYTDTKITYIDLKEDEVISSPMQEKLHEILDRIENQV